MVKNLLLVLSLILLLSSCSVVRSDVTVFHNLPSNPRATTYAFIPIKGQKASLEYQAYQKRVRAELANHGFREVQITHSPDAVISFVYGIGDGKNHVSSVPIFGQTGVSSSQTFGTVSTYGGYGTYSGYTTYTPTYGVVGSTTVTTTLFTRKLRLFIVDGPSSLAGKPKMLYEGTVVSTGESSQLAPIMPYMIRSLFQDFPGNSGSTKRVEFPME